MCTLFGIPPPYPQHAAEEQAHYGKLDHSGKKKAAVVPAGDAEYGKLDRVRNPSMHTQCT